MWQDLGAVADRFIFAGTRARYVRFPLGGIGAGGFAISGSGRLVDWSIRNRPALNSYNGYSHFAIKAEREGELLDARVLNGPYDEVPAGGQGLRPAFDGFGHGALRQSLVGLPHFSDTVFYGRFPVADLTYADLHFPGRVRQTAFSPFIPHEERKSALPAALFVFEIENTGPDEIAYTLAGTLGNLGNDSGRHTYSERDGISALTLAGFEDGRAPEERGDLTIATDAPAVCHQDHHFRGQWFDDLTVFWKDFARPGPLPERHYDGPRATRHMGRLPEHGTLAARITVPPGGRASVRFVIAWSFPRGDIYWALRDKPDSPDPPGATPLWTNYYATQWTNSLAAARDALARWDTLAAPTFAFRDALFGSSLPAEIVDAATSTLAVLRTATVIRLADGTLWGWEGQHRDAGSCEGSCTHVWNYQQALGNLFPRLERSLREAEWTYNQMPSGALTFRQKLPLGNGFDVVGPCADGHFGAIVKTYRDWRRCGDTAWLKRLWPNVKRAIAYAWSKDNPDRWDPDETGILSGRQHQTLDMELYGPNSWLASFYVAALLAAARMAEALGEADFAEKCARMARAGAAYIDSELFNGRYYFHRIDLSDRSVLEAFDTGRNAGVLADDLLSAYWSAEHGEIKYQFGEASIADQILGQWHAETAGLGGFLDEAHVRSALASVFAENFVPDMRAHANPCRNFAYEDEAGLVIAAYPDGARQPVVAAPYAEETWTGIEYASASHMIMHGLVDEGLTVVRAARGRYDGARRNPFSEIECGSYYVRSLSAWQLVNAWSGLVADQVERRLSFCPVETGEFDLFWSSGTAWGRLVRLGAALKLVVLGGRLDIDEVIVTGRRFPVAELLASAGE